MTCSRDADLRRAGRRRRRPSPRRWASPADRGLSPKPGRSGVISRQTSAQRLALRPPHRARQREGVQQHHRACRCRRRRRSGGSWVVLLHASSWRQTSTSADLLVVSPQQQANGTPSADVDVCRHDNKHAHSGSPIHRYVRSLSSSPRHSHCWSATTSGMPAAFSAATPVLVRQLPVRSSLREVLHVGAGRPAPRPLVGDAAVPQVEHLQPLQDARVDDRP